MCCGMSAWLQQNKESKDSIPPQNHHACSPPSSIIISLKLHYITLALLCLCKMRYSELIRIMLGRHGIRCWKLIFFQLLWESKFLRWASELSVFTCPWQASFKKNSRPLLYVLTALVLNLKQNSMAWRHALFLGRHALFDSAMPFCLAPCHQNVPLIKIFTC